MASPKSVSYALSLLSKAGYSTRHMDSSFKDLGATMKERSGTVQNWLEKMPQPEISKLIDSLK